MNSKKNASAKKSFLSVSEKCKKKEEKKKMRIIRENVNFDKF